MTLAPIQNWSKRRDKLVIMAEIIGIAKNGTSKTHIMFRAHLSFNQINQYLKLLQNIGLLEKSACDRRVVYKATQKGLEFMEKQQQIMDLLNEGVC